MSRTYVFAVEFQVPASERVGPVLELHQESLIDLGARYAFVYESIPEPGKVLVVIGIRTEQPLLNLLRSPYFFEWFDAVGVNELPAVFAGEKVERFDLGDPPRPGSDLVVAAEKVTPEDITFLATRGHLDRIPPSHPSGGQPGPPQSGISFAWACWQYTLRVAMRGIILLVVPAVGPEPAAGPDGAALIQGSSMR